VKRYFLYLDDIRVPDSYKHYALYDMIFVCRSAEDAYQMILSHDWFNVHWEMSLDHDLGDGQPTGYDFVKRIIEYDMNVWPSTAQTGDCSSTGRKFFNRLDVTVHSMNPVGKDNMLKLIENYREQLKENANVR